MLTVEDLERMNKINEVYYRIWIGDNDFKFHIIKMQHFNEYQYEQSKFLNNECYNTEKDAYIFLQNEYTKSKFFVNFFYNTFGY